jgi:hypothetical protein
MDSYAEVLNSYLNGEGESDVVDSYIDVPAGNLTRASKVGGDHSREEPFKQLINSYMCT